MRGSWETACSRDISSWSEGTGVGPHQVLLGFDCGLLWLGEGVNSPALLLCGSRGQDREEVSVLGS